MPRISQFYGITIAMFFGDHNPPQFHAYYGERRGRFGLDGALLEGNLPRRARRLIRTWAAMHQDELMVCWNRVRQHKPPGTIEPLS